MRTLNLTLELFQNTLDNKSLDIVNYLLEQHPILTETMIRDITRYFYSKQIKSSLILRSIMEKNSKYKKNIMSESLKYNHLHILELFIGDELVDILNYALNHPRIIDSIIDYYYINGIILSIILEKIINTGNVKDKNLIIFPLLMYNGLDTLKLFINNGNVNGLLIRSIKKNNIEETIYIAHNFKYHESIITGFLTNRDLYITQ
jgi:hypothetical protein